MTQYVEVLRHYDCIAAASARMLEAARNDDWDGLIAAESECAELVAELTRLDPECRVRMQPADNQRRLHALGEVLTNDAQIRSLTQQWMRSLEGMLGTTQQGHRAHRSYLAFGPGGA
jgi:flagellar protein FliT